MTKEQLTEMARLCADKFLDSVWDTTSVWLDVKRSLLTEAILTALQSLNDAHETKISDLRSLLRDSCEEEETIRKACRGFLTDFEIDGDSYGVPGMSDIVASLLQQVEALKAELAAAKGVK